MVSVSLAGKVALVSGGSRGIGRAAAILLAQAGARVALGYQRDEKAAEEVRASIGQAKGQAVAIREDLSRWDQARHLVTRCFEELAAPDNLVVNHDICKHA